MKITEIHITSFGGLKDKIITPSDGFNIIYGDNEAGKTTVLTFIRAIFYGAGANRGTDLSKKIREKYSPWNGEPMMGSISFEHEGRRYRIARTFGKTDRQDIAELCDLDLGKTEKVKGSLGERFLGIGLDAFTRCFFIGEGGRIDAGEGELSGKLSAIAQTGDETVSYDTVIKRLSGGRELLVSKSGKKGTLVDDEKSRDGIIEQLSEALKSEEEIKQLVEQSDEENRKLKSLEEERNRLQALLGKYHKVKNAEKRQELDACKKAMEEIESALVATDGSAVTQDIADELLSAYNSIKDLDAQLEENIKETESSRAKIGTDTEQETERKTEEIKDQLKILGEEKLTLDNEIGKLQRELSRADAEAIAKKSSKKAVSMPLLGISALFMLAGALLFFLPLQINGQLPGAVLFVVALAALALAFILRPSDKAALEEAESAIARIEADIDTSKSKLGDIEQTIGEYNGQLTELRISFDKKKTMQEGELVALSERKTKLEAQKADAEYRASQLLQRICGERDISVIPDKIAFISDAIRSRDMTEMRISLLSKQISDADTEFEERDEGEETEELTDINDIDFKAISDKISKLDIEISEQHRTAARTEADLRAISESFESPEGIRKKIDAIKERIDEKKRFLEISELASKILTDSFAELRRGYGSDIDEKTLKIFSRLTADRYKNIRVTTDFDIEAMQKNFPAEKNIGYLSTGTVDQAYLSLRLAVADMISGDNRIPIMMDDSLAQYDDTRASRALSFLAEYSGNTQILLFTCHGHIRDEGMKNGADIISL